MSKSPKISITMKSELLRKMDDMRGNVNRSKMVSLAVTLGLAQMEQERKSPTPLS